MDRVFDWLDRFICIMSFGWAAGYATANIQAQRLAGEYRNIGDWFIDFVIQFTVVLLISGLSLGVLRYVAEAVASLRARGRARALS